MEVPEGSRGGVSPICMAAKATVKIKNIAAPKVKVQAALPAANMAPPIAGPMKRDMLKIIELVAMAEGSRSRPTKV